VPRRENVNGPSGLLYQLIKSRPLHVSVTVFLIGEGAGTHLNFPEVLNLADSGVKFILCTAPSKLNQAPWYWPLGARRIAGFDLPSLSDFDAVWAYPYWFAPFLQKIQLPVLISGMDCATLLYWRKLKNTSLKSPIKFLRSSAGLIANAFFESRYLRHHQVHVVGKADAKALQRFSVNANFMSHPTLDYQPTDRPYRHPERPIIFLLSNPGDPFYGSHRYLSWVRDLFKRSVDEHLIHLIVHKATPDSSIAIEAVARHYPRVTVEFVTWVDDYSKLLSMIDIQLFPLDVGAGTKTSVLTALQHGVHTVCSPIAAENVQLNPLLFTTDDTFGSFDEILRQALLSLSRGDSPTRMAEILTLHSPEVCGEQFWNYLEQHEK